MKKVSFFYHLLISILLHFFVFLLIFQYNSESEWEANLKSGVVVTTNLVFLERKTSSFLNSEIAEESSHQEIGTLVDEISKFQNSLSYPPLALERGWETECEWEVEIIEGKILNWKYLKACSYEIFRTTVENSFQTWTFSTSLTKKIKIPIRFKIQERN